VRKQKLVICIFASVTSKDLEHTKPCQFASGFISQVFSNFRQTADLSYLLDYRASSRSCEFSWHQRSAILRQSLQQPLPEDAWII